VMLRLGFEGLGLHRIVARIDERNESSVRLAMPAGQDQRITRVRRRDLRRRRIGHSLRSSGNHAQPSRQHRTRRENVTSDHPPQHQAQAQAQEPDLP
jgi:RimJ/RimL family protein N-acetyltransferase